MDQVVIDVGDTPVQPGDPAILFGPGHRGEPTVAEWADWADTIPHEIVTGIGHRVRRTTVTDSVRRTA
jgi:alanine racemase